MNLERFILPKDAQGNDVVEPLLWYLPPPCATLDMIVDEKVEFNLLLQRIIDARLAAEGVHHAIDSLSISELISPCRGKTAHVYEVSFDVPPNAIRSKMREDIQAASALGVKKIVVGNVITRLPSVVPEGRGGLPYTPPGLIPATYYVHCAHNKRYAGNGIPKTEEEYVRVKQFALWP